MHTRKEYPPIGELRQLYGRNKKIPAEFEHVILKALSHYPELKDAYIKFELKKNHPVPYGTSPSPGTVLRSAKKRKYVISLLEDADLPMREALFKNLPEEAQIGAIGHELGHVLQFRKQSFPGLIKTTYLYGGLHERRETERDADLCAIQHGLGFELYVLAVFIRKIPGYVEQRKEIETDYLKPQEILDTLPADAPAV